MNAGALRVVAETMRVDAMTAEVVGALRAAGVEPVLLKGPVLAAWLYEEGERSYRDCDLLVAPADGARAGHVLTALSFARVPRAWEHPDRFEHDGPWHRPGTGTVDLHRMLPGVHGVSPEQLWGRLAGHLRRTPLPGTGIEVTALDEPALALLVGLHAAHHRPHPDLRAGPLADLERAVNRVPVATWRDAASLARRLRAAGQLARGLHMVAGGAALARHVALPAPARGERDWDRSLLRALLPAPSYLRWSEAPARGGGLALAKAYAVRPREVLRARHR